MTRARADAVILRRTSIHSPAMAASKYGYRSEGRAHAGLPCALISGDCLASDIDFAITSGNEIVARAEMSLESACKPKPGGFHVQCSRSRHRSRISGRTGGDAG